MDIFRGQGLAYSNVWSWHVNIKDFFYDVRYIIFFYVLGDLLTTFFAIETGMGYEANLIMARLIEIYGFLIVAVIKMLFMCLLFIEYAYLKNMGYHSLWGLGRQMISFMGLFIVINNMLVIYGIGSPLQLMCAGMGLF
ncbi:DUF5658 family protein [Methanolobus sp. WCC5]|uniref:DUF5658 family protein n=1 Tax=Methanolobus sp. WCC5 TaxID=3125785 RepID=UPI003255E748